MVETGYALRTLQLRFLEIYSYREKNNLCRPTLHDIFPLLYT